MKIIKPVDLICLNDKNQILLCLRAEDEFGYKETWSIPGGDSETGESLEETINREIKEELDCEVRWFKFFRSYKVPLTDELTVKATYVYGQIDGNISLSKELLSYRWINLDINKIKKMNFAFNQKDVVLDFVEFFTKNSNITTA